MGNLKFINTVDDLVRSKMSSCEKGCAIKAAVNVILLIVVKPLNNASIQNHLRGVIKTYGECLNKKITTVKDIAINPLKILPLASNTLIPSFLPLSEAVLEVLFRECL
jgi:hypothetical protein